MRLKPQQERLLQLPGPPSPRRTRPTPQPDNEDSDISLKTCSYHHLILFIFYFFSSSWLFHLSSATHYTNYKRGGSHIWTQPAAGDTRGGGARQKEASTRYWSSQDVVAEVATREDPFGSRGRGRRGGAQPHRILRFLTGLGKTRAVSPPQWGCVERSLGLHP